MTLSSNTSLLTPNFDLTINQWIEKNVIEDIKVNRLKGYGVANDTNELLTYANIIAKGGSIPPNKVNLMVEHLLSKKPKYKRELKSVANRRMELQQIVREIIRIEGYSSRAWVEEYDPVLISAINIVEIGYLRHISTRKLHILICFYYFECLRKRVGPDLSKGFISRYEYDTLEHIKNLVDIRRITQFFQLRKECILEISRIFDDSTQVLIGRYFQLSSLSRLNTMSVFDKKVAEDKVSIMNEYLTIVVIPPSNHDEFEIRYGKLTELLIRIYKV